MIATMLVIFVAALHAYFLYLEMCQWEAPRTRAAFGTTAEFASSTKVLAANQGLYNGFLAMGLGLALWARDTNALIFCLACVIVAGIYGAATRRRKILLIKPRPADVALIPACLKL